MPHKLARFWWACHAKLIWIRDVNGDTVPLIPNDAQAMLQAAMMLQAAAGKPIRVVILKGRKRGISTYVQALGVFLVSGWTGQQCKTLAHTSEATEEIFGIARHIAVHMSPAIPLDAGIRKVSCRETGSWYHCYTAGGEGVGAGGTPTLLHRSELALWGTFKADADKTSGESVPYVPNTIIIDESTAEGRDLFYGRFCDAGDAEHPFEPLFIAWYVNEDYAVPVEGPFVHDDDEKAILRRAHADGVEVSNEAFAWRRMKIREMGEGSFRQQHPSTPAEAVQGSKGLIFPNMRDALIHELPFDPQSVPWEDRVGGNDPGYSPDPCVFWTGFYRDGHLYLTDFWRKNETMAAERVEALHEGHTYYVDPPEHVEQRELRMAAERMGKRCRIVAAPRHKRPGEDCARVELLMVQQLLREGRLHVLYSVAAQLIVECDTLAWDEKTNKADDKRTPECGHYDSIKALTYVVMGVLEREPVKPRVARRALSRHAQFAKGW